jgi:hypothetical protein
MIMALLYAWLHTSMSVRLREYHLATLSGRSCSVFCELGARWLACAARNRLRFAYHERVYVCFAGFTEVEDMTLLAFVGRACVGFIAALAFVRQACSWAKVIACSLYLLLGAPVTQAKSSRSAR